MAEATTALERMTQAVHSVGAPDADIERAVKLEQRAELQKIIDEHIRQIDGMVPPPANKASILENLRAARGGNIAALAQAIINLRAELPAVVAQTEMNIAAHYYAAEHYPDYAEYSPEGQAFIRKQMGFAMENSPELRRIVERYEALPTAEKESAEAEQRANQKLVREMLKDEKYKDFHDELRIFRSTGMASGPDAQELLAKLKNGELSQDEFKKIVTDGVAKIAAQNNTFINDYVKKVPQQSQDALRAEFGDADGRIDCTKITMEWGKLRLKDKDAAYKSLAQNNGDISKLDPQQQRIIHMAQVMVAAETKTIIEGAMQIVARNQEIAKQLTDPNLSVEAKMAILDKEERRQGVRVSDPGYYREGLKQAVLAINETVHEGKPYDPNKSGDFLKAVGENVAENYEELFAGKTNLNNYQKLAFYAAIAKSEAAPGWHDKERSAVYTSEWQALEDAQHDNIMKSVVAVSAIQNGAGIDAKTAEALAKLSPEDRAAVQQASNALGGTVSVDSVHHVAGTEVPTQLAAQQTAKGLEDRSASVW